MSTRRTTYTYSSGSKRSGKSCSHCSTTYATCSKNLFEKDKGPCCATCMETDTHDVEVLVPGDPDQPPKTIALEELRYIPEMLDSVEATLTGLSRIEKVEIELEMEGLFVLASFRNGSWYVTLR